MCKLSLLLLLLGATATFAAFSSAFAKGGTYHHADFVPVRSAETTKKPISATVHRHRRPPHQR
jgi:hypothetical protein